MAVAVVAMFLLTACACVAESDAANGPSIYGSAGGSGTSVSPYTVDMSVGQTFTYAFATNLDSHTDDGKVVYTWAKSGSTYLDPTSYIKITDGKQELTGKFTAAGTYEGLLTAKWTQKNDTELTQTATQYFRFYVAEDIDVPDKNLYIQQSAGAAGTTVGTSTYTNATSDNKSKTDVTFAYGKVSSGAFATDSTNPFTATASDGTITVKVGTAALDSDGLTTDGSEWAIQVTATNSITGDTDTGIIKVYVYSDILITASSSDTMYNYVGGKGNTRTFSYDVNYDDDHAAGTVSTGETMTVSPDTPTVMTLDSGNDQITTTVENVKDSTEGIKQTFVGTVTATGTYKTSDDTTKETSTTKTFTFVVYNALAFTSKPETMNLVAAPVSTGSNITALTAYVKGATDLSFNWGDGTSSSVVTSGAENSYTALHTYTQKGMYTITITASNDMGTTTDKVLYSVGADMAFSDLPTKDEAKEKTESFLDEHGWQFILFGILAILGLALLAYFGYWTVWYYDLIVIVLAILAVLCFVYGDVAGIIDAIKG